MTRTIALRRLLAGLCFTLFALSMPLAATAAIQEVETTEQEQTVIDGDDDGLDDRVELSGGRINGRCSSAPASGGLFLGAFLVLGLVRGRR